MGRPWKTPKIEISKQFVLKRENAQQNKWMEIRVHFSDRTIRNQLTEMVFTSRKVKQKPALISI